MLSLSLAAHDRPKGDMGRIEISHRSRLPQRCILRFRTIKVYTKDPPMTGCEMR